MIEANRGGVFYSFTSVEHAERWLGQPDSRSDAKLPEADRVCFNARQEPIPVFRDEELKRLTMPGIVFVGGRNIMLRSQDRGASPRAVASL